VLDCVVADSPKIERLAHGAVDMGHLEALEEPEHLHVFPLSGVS